MNSPRQSRAFELFIPALLIGVLWLSSAGAQSCDWQRGDLHKMHWPQLPDMSATGMDVSLSRTILADDFKCTASGPINAIHLWGSFLDDNLPKAGSDSLTFEVSIYSDIPAEKGQWSRPDEPLWTRVFRPGEYTSQWVHDGPEGWYDPVRNLYLPDNHRQAFQYSFCVDAEPFIQEAGTVYWLVVKHLSESPNFTFGWKSTPWRLHWNDDAVYQHSQDRGWLEMTYPREHRDAGETLDLAFVITGGDETLPEHDLGDAPDSSNELAGADMLAYPSGVNGRFPTVYQAGSPPHGPRHLHPRDMVYLGRWVSLENEADLGPDEDIVNNLDPLNDACNRDGADDGLHLPVVMPNCQRTTLDYTVTVTAMGPVFLNVWCDWNRDGDWDDTVVCPDGVVVPEWAVQNHQPMLPGPGVHTLTTPPFVCRHPTTNDDLDPMWLRITIAERLWEPIVGAAAVGGAGPPLSYRYGETEDYYLRPQKEPSPARYDWGDAPDGVAAPGYPTLADHNGARHAIAGPWLGNANDRPDPETNGQPDLAALGDDTGGSNDENGVSIPPLVQGQPQAATVQVMGGGGVVQAWIDFDGDRTWQDREQIFDGYLPDGIHVMRFTVPDDIAAGQSFARIRISTRGGLDPGGPALDGEVEDHEVWIHILPPDMKWHQWPDLTPYGIDVRVDNSDETLRILADDFQCKSHSLLTHVRLWGSWRDDERGEIKKIRLGVHPDDPVGPAGADKRNKYSKPGPETLWEMEFLPDEFEEKLYYVGYIAGEWWWDPATGRSTPGGDTRVWQIDVEIDPNDAFLQTGSADKPQIYWLSVETETADGQFGWKTRYWPEHFMDDAVWHAGDVLPRLWEELRYPDGHRYYDHEKNSIDLAFCLMFTPESLEPVTCQPVCITRCPPEETTCPAVLTQCPVFETRCPPLETTCPAMKTQCPAEETRCPLVRTTCPPIQTLCPPAPTNCIGGGVTQCPPIETQCPPVETECTIEQTKCPVLETRCPPLDTSCPVAPTQCPPVETECTIEQTKCPILETRCPPVETKCPPLATECFVIDTTCPPVETKCPVASTSCPVFATRCPPVETRCPATITKCNVITTQCPPIETQCPRCFGALTEDILPETVLLGSESRQEAAGPPPGSPCPAVETLCPTVGDYLAMARTSK